MLYHRTMLEPNTFYPIPTGMYYILMTIKKTVFALDVVSETVLPTLLQNGFRLGDFRKAKHSHQKAYKPLPPTLVHPPAEERPITTSLGKKNLVGTNDSESVRSAQPIQKKMWIAPATRWIHRSPTPEPAAALFVLQPVHPSPPEPMVVAQAETMLYSPSLTPIVVSPPAPVVVSPPPDSVFISPPPPETIAPVVAPDLPELVLTNDQA
ncbi:hypothetical protein NPIL_440161 [Nephila pilipes]|uniref:Uncharacterized protein n=1 Tax=Nephila pilipes TaxID=299642 RepID=A0A8X6QZC6_NEPPI|nr:hypothetical protein NPIL_440161 [Nephila pilipes]